MLPAEDTGSPADLKQGNQQSVQCEQILCANISRVLDLGC